jgi:SAM-dependent methyltransferase
VGKDDWFRQAFGTLYPILYPHRDDESASREILALLKVLRVEPKKGRALDLACGTGRHTVALREAGFDVYGLDLSPVLLGTARERPRLQGRIVQGDMRNLPFQEEFHLVFNLFTSFGYFSDTENEKAVCEMARILRPGGQLVMDHINVQNLARTLVEEDCRMAGRFRIRQRRRILDRRVHKEITISGEDDLRSTIREDVRLYRPDEIQSLLSRAGFQIVELLGSFQGSPLTGESERMIVIARKNNVGLSA